MGDLLLLEVSPPLFIGIIISFLIEHLLQPGVLPFWKRPSAAFALHVGLWLLLFSFELAVFRRPWFAAAIVLIFMLIVVLVSNAKFQFLGEPFILQDYEYFIDTLMHPRLFIPFFGLGKALVAFVGFGVAMFAGLTFELSLTSQVANTNFFLAVASLIILGITLLWLGARKKLPVVFEPETDLLQLGMLASLWRYGEEEYSPCKLPPHSQFTKPAEEISGKLPNLVVVQSESFFDVRNTIAGIRTEILQEFDSLQASATCQGKLKVPAWGANTVRTEFAFLSGLNPKKLGVHRFNPYRKLARQGAPTLASFLKNLGYRTVCVHPYPASFYSRDKVFPLLGFDDFIDIRSFDSDAMTGPYVGDVALAEKVCALLGDSLDQPIFVFAITMENHGPLHLEKVHRGDEGRLYLNPPPNGCDDLTIYLRHLRNADRMARILRDYLQAMPGSNWLCWFGDHVPIMSKVYRAMGKPDGQTDYLIWEKDGTPSDQAYLALEIENLGPLLLEKMGLVSSSVEDVPERRPPQASS